MKIAYVTMFDATDPKNWSGLDLHIWKSLEKQGMEIELIGNLRHGRSLARRLRRLWGTRVERRTFLHFWDTATARDYAADVAERLLSTNADVVLCPSPIPLAYLNCPQPRVIWTDATFAGLSSFYPEFLPSNICSASTASGREIDRLSLDNCQLAIYSSDWAAQTAIVVHPEAARKVHVVPYGANLEAVPPDGDIDQILGRRGNKPIRLLFIGMDWIRKGGGQAVDVARELIRRGLPVELTLVGAPPPPEVRGLPFVRMAGYVDKSTADGRTRLSELFKASHFLILTSLAECCAVVLSEACAFGVPVAATDVGGMGTVIRSGINGQLFEVGSPPAQWADWIISIISQPQAYRGVATAALQSYRGRFNWDVAGASVISLMRRRLSLGPSKPAPAGI